MTTLNEMLYRVSNLEPGQSADGVNGQMAYFIGTDTLAGRYVNNPIVLATTPEALEAAKGAGEDFKRVFDTYQRVSIATKYPNNEEAVPKELTTWQLIDGRIRCTINSVGFVGFVAPDAYDDYTYIVNLRVMPGHETFNDDDRIGLILGHYKDKGGVVHNLSYYYNRDSNIIRALVYNYSGVSTATLKTIVSTSDKGFHATTAAAGCRVRVVRKGNVLTISSTKGYMTIAERDAAAYEPAYEIVYDLSTTIQGRRFLGPQRYGYMAHSQDAASYEVLSKPGGSAPIYDLKNNEMWVKDGGVWIVKPTDTVFTKGMFYNDTLNGNYFHFDGTTLKELS